MGRLHFLLFPEARHEPCLVQPRLASLSRNCASQHGVMGYVGLRACPLCREDGAFDV